MYKTIPMNCLIEDKHREWERIRISIGRAFVFVIAASNTMLAAAAPATVALLKPVPGEAKAVNVIPLLTFSDGEWIRPEPIMYVDDEPDPLLELPADQRDLLDSLLQTKFAVPNRPSIQVTLETKSVADIMIEPRYAAMTGNATGLLDGGFGRFSYIVSNAQSPNVEIERGRPAPVTIKIATQELPERIANRIRSSSSLAFKDSGFTFDGELFARPMIDDCAFISVADGLTFVWTRLFVGYPVRRSETNLGDESVWSGFHYAITRMPEQRLIWEDISVAGEGWNSTSLVAATDLNRDGVPELVLRKQGYESVTYSVQTFDDDKLMVLSEVSGGV